MMIFFCCGYDYGYDYDYDYDDDDELGNKDLEESTKSSFSITSLSSTSILGTNDRKIHLIHQISHPQNKTNKKNPTYPTPEPKIKQEPHDTPPCSTSSSTQATAQQTYPQTDTGCVRTTTTSQHAQKTPRRSYEYCIDQRTSVYVSTRQKS